jgi:predicted Mrr-cat superfamily restriction endonuclease
VLLTKDLRRRENQKLGQDLMAIILLQVFKSENLAERMELVRQLSSENQEIHQEVKKRNKDIIKKVR